MAIKKLLLALCVIGEVCASGLHAQSISSSIKNPTRVPKTKKASEPTRPKMPSLDWDAVEFSYSNGIAYFAMPDYVTYIEVAMENESGETFSSCVYSANPIWNVSLPQGEYYIECDADEGSRFEGVVYID